MILVLCSLYTVVSDIVDHLHRGRLPTPRQQRTTRDGEGQIARDGPTPGPRSTTAEVFQVISGHMHKGSGRGYSSQVRLSYDGGLYKSRSKRIPLIEGSIRKHTPGIAQCYQRHLSQECNEKKKKILIFALETSDTADKTWGSRPVMPLRLSVIYVGLAALHVGTRLSK